MNLWQNPNLYVRKQTYWLVSDETFTSPIFLWIGKNFGCSLDFTGFMLVTSPRKFTDHPYQNWTLTVLMWCGDRLSMTFSVIEAIIASWPPEEAFVNTGQPVDNSDINDRQASQRLLVLLGSLSQPHRGLCLCTQFIHHYQTSHRFRASIHTFTGS